MLPLLWVVLKSRVPSGCSRKKQSHLCPLRIEGRAAGSKEETQWISLQKEWEQDVLSACQCLKMRQSLIVHMSLLIQSYEHSRCSVNVCKLTSTKMPRTLVTSVFFVPRPAQLEHLTKALLGSSGKHSEGLPDINLVPNERIQITSNGPSRWSEPTLRNELICFKSHSMSESPGRVWPKPRKAGCAPLPCSQGRGRSPARLPHTYRVQWCSITAGSGCRSGK